MNKSLFSLLLFFSLSFDLIDLGLHLNLLSKYSDIERNPKISSYVFRLMEVDSIQSDDHLQIDLYTCYNGSRLEELYKSVTDEEMNKIEKFINLLESRCECILYFFLTEGIHQLNLLDINRIYSKTFFGLKDIYEYNCLASDFSQGSTLLKYLDHTSELMYLQQFLEVLLNNYESFLMLGESRILAYQLKLNFLSYKNCIVKTKASKNSSNPPNLSNPSNESNALVCWMKYIISLQFGNLKLFDFITEVIGFKNINCDDQDIGIEILIRNFFPLLYLQYKNHSLTLNLIKDIIFELTGASLPFNLYQTIRNLFGRFSI